MAEKHTGTGATAEPHGHHGVAFEPQDVDSRAVALVGLCLGGFLLVTAAFVAWLYLVLLRAEAPRKESQLPPAVTDRMAERLPPEPRLEGIEELRDPENTRYRIYPERAEAYYEVQRKALESTEGGKLKIKDAIAEAAKVLPARKDAPPGSEPPKTFIRRLPAKSASGSRELGDL